MAAEKDLPLETIIIIVAIIVVLFIAIFFGALFINTRLRKQRILSARPGSVKNETGGRGEYRYTGGNGGGSKDANSDKRDLIKTFIGESRSLLDLSDHNKKLAGVDTIHNMFRSSGIDVSDKPMKEFYMSSDTDVIDNCKTEFNKIIDDKKIVSDDNAKEIASMIDSVKIVLNSVKNCTYTVNNRVDYLKQIKDKDLQEILTNLLDNEYNRLVDSDIEQFNKNLNFLVTLPNDIDETQDVPNIVKQLIKDRTNVNSVIQHCGVLNKDLDPMIRMHIDAGFYLEILRILNEENQIAAVLNTVFQTLKTDTNNYVGLYMMMCKLGGRGRLNKYITDNPNIVIDVDHTKEVAMGYINAQIYTYPELTNLSFNFSSIKDDAKKQLQSVVSTPQPGGANAKSSDVLQQPVKLDDYIKQQDVEQNIIYIIESYLKYVNICAPANDQFRLDAFNELFKFMPNIDEFRKFAKDVLEKDNIDTKQLSNDIVNKYKIVNKYNLTAQTVSDLYTKMHKYINDSIKFRIDAFVADRTTNSVTTKAKFKKLADYAKNLTHLDVISGLIISNTGFKKYNLQLIRYNRIWIAIDTGKSKIYDKYATAINSTTPDNVTIQTIFSNTDKDLKTLSDYLNTNMTGDWSKAFEYLHKNRYNNTYIRSLMKYIEYICDTENIKNDIFKPNFVKDKLDALGQKDNNEKIATLIDTKSTSLLKTDKLRDFMTGLFIKSDDFKNPKHHILLIVNELIKIITFIGDKDNLGDYETKLVDLKTNVLTNINNLATAYFTPEFAGKINNFDTNIITGYETKFSKFKLAKQQFDKLSALVTTNPINDNYDAAKKLFKDGIKKEQNSTKLATNLDEFKLFLERQSKYDAAVVDIREITSVLSATDRAAAQNMITDANNYYAKFYELLEKIHNITEKYHDTYKKIFEELTTSLGSVAVDTGMITNFDKMNQNHVLANIVSTASIALSKSVNLPNNTPGSDGYNLHTSITDINTKISGYTTDIGNMRTNISNKVTAQVSGVVSEIDSNLAILRPKILKIEEDKDIIYPNITNLLRDGLDQKDALILTNENKGLINNLQGLINALKQLDINISKDLIDNAALVGADTTELSDKVKEYNDLITSVENFATDCSEKLFNDAIEKAKNLADDCDSRLKVLPKIDTNILVDYINNCISINSSYFNAIKYTEIAAKVNDNKDTRYTDVMTKITDLGLFGRVTTLNSGTATHINDLLDISASVTAAQDAFDSIDPNVSTSADKPIVDINIIKAENATKLTYVDAIDKDTGVVEYLNTIGIDIKDIRNKMDTYISQIDTILMNSINSKKAAELEEKKVADNAAIAAANKLAIDAIAVIAADITNLRTATVEVINALNFINTTYNTKYDKEKAQMKAAAELNAKQITDKLPDIKTDLDKTIADMISTENTIKDITGVNTTEVAVSTAAILNVRNDLASIEHIYNNLKNLDFDTLIQTEIDKLDQTIFIGPTKQYLKSCGEFIADIDSSKTVDIAMCATYLDTVTKTYIPELNRDMYTILKSLTTDIPIKIETNLIKPNNDEITSINTIINNGNVGKVTTDATAASTKLSDVITADKAAISTINTTVHTYITTLPKIYNDNKAIVDTIPQIGGVSTQERKNALEALAEIKEFKDNTIPTNVTKITDNLTSIDESLTKINQALRDVATKAELSDKITELEKVYTEYNAAKDLKTATERINDNIKQIAVKINILVDVINLSKNIVENNLAVSNSNDAALVKVTEANGIYNNNQRRRAAATTKLANVKTKVDNITAKVSSLQDRNIASSLNAVNTAFARLQRKDADIGTKLIELNTLKTNNIANKQSEIASNLDKFTDQTNNFDKDLAHWVDIFKMNPVIGHTIFTLSNKIAGKSTRIKNAIDAASLDPIVVEIDNTVHIFEREKANVIAAIEQLRTVYQLVMDEDDDDGPSITPQQPEDDTVKPFSKESYDILPLDSKVATLSSNIQFDETKSMAMNNPGNSFMYKIVSYDSKELSSDDKILEIISFARTQRMPIKDSKNIIAKATELIKKYRGTNKIIPGAWIYRGGKWFASVKQAKIEELERYVELMKLENQFEIPRATGGGHRLRI